MNPLPSLRFCFSVFPTIYACVFPSGAFQLFPCIPRVKPISTAGQDVPHYAVYCSRLQFALLSPNLCFPVNVGDPVAHAANHDVQQLTPY